MLCLLDLSISDRGTLKFLTIKVGSLFLLAVLTVWSSVDRHLHIKDYVILEYWPLYHYMMPLFILITFVALKSSLFKINITTPINVLLISVHISLFIFNLSVSLYLKWLRCPDRCGSVGWASSHKAKGCLFNFWWGHMPGLQVPGEEEPHVSPCPSFKSPSPKSLCSRRVQSPSPIPSFFQARLADLHPCPAPSTRFLRGVGVLFPPSLSPGVSHAVLSFTSATSGVFYNPSLTTELARPSTYITPSCLLYHCRRSFHLYIGTETHTHTHTHTSIHNKIHCCCYYSE